MNSIPKQDVKNTRFSRLTEEGLQLKIRHNQKVQTDVHILPPYIDKDYTSNIWELKRRALRLVRILSMFQEIIFD